MSMMRRDEFVRKVTQMVRTKFPLVEISAEEAQFSVRINGHLARLENLYRLASHKPEEMQYHVNRWIVELLRANEGSPDAEAGFETLKDRIMPMVLSVQACPGDGPIVSQPLVSGLQVAYAIDSDRTIAYLTQAHFKEWKVSLDTLHETALANLVARSEQLQAHAAQDDETGEVTLIIVQQMDGYDASRLLLPNLHGKLREMLGSPFLAGIPNRDILLCFREDERTVSRLLPQIRDDFRRMPHQVTDKLFTVTADGIAPRN